MHPQVRQRCRSDKLCERRRRCHDCTHPPARRAFPSRPCLRRARSSRSSRPRLSCLLPSSRWLCCRTCRCVQAGKKSTGRGLGAWPLDLARSNKHFTKIGSPAAAAPAPTSPPGPIRSPGSGSGQTHESVSHCSTGRIRIRGASLGAYQEEVRVAALRQSEHLARDADH